MKTVTVKSNLKHLSLGKQNKDLRLDGNIEFTTDNVTRYEITDEQPYWLVTFALPRESPQGANSDTVIDLLSEQLKQDFSVWIKDMIAKQRTEHKRLNVQDEWVNS